MSDVTSTANHPWKCWIVATLAALITVNGAHAQCRYEIAIIQGPRCGIFGYAPTEVSGINRTGMVTGTYRSCLIGPEVPFTWTPESGLLPIDLPPGEGGPALDVNDAGQVAGWFRPQATYGALAFVHDASGLTVIYPPAGSFSQALALNNDGWIVGATADGTDYYKAFLWQKGVMTLIPPTWGPRSLASDLNELGAAVGWMGTGPHIDAHPFVWHDGVMTDLGLVETAFSGTATGINNRGEIIVSMRIRHPSDPGFVIRGFVVSHGLMHDLGVLPGYEWSPGFGINEISQVVGLCSHPNPNDLRAFIWQNGVMRDLNELVLAGRSVVVQIATAINDFGQIAAYGYDAKSDVVAFLLTPVGSAQGDLDIDCEVGIRDLLLLLRSWGTCDPGLTCIGDINDDMAVNPADLAILLENWG